MIREQRPREMRRHPRRFGSWLTAATERWRKDCLYHLDLLVAAWQWPDGLVEKFTGLSSTDLEDIRNHWREAPDDLVTLVQALNELQWLLWSCRGSRSYADWWRAEARFREPVGTRTPLAAVDDLGPAAIEALSDHLRTWLFS